MRLHDNPLTLFRLKGTQLVCSLLCIIFLASCGNGKSGKNTEDAARDTATAGKANTTGEEDTIEDLLEMYDGQERNLKNSPYTTIQSIQIYMLNMMLKEV